MKAHLCSCCCGIATVGGGEHKGERETHAGGTLLKRNFSKAATAAAALIAVFQF